MFGSNDRKLNWKSGVGAALIGVVTGSTIADARDLSNHSVLGQMETDHYFPYIAGVIEGVAYLRYKEGGDDSEAMNCVYDWFYEDDRALDTIYAAFGKFPDYPPASVIAAVVNTKCPG